MQVKTLTIEDLTSNNFITIDPGCRTNGGTGIAVFNSKQVNPTEVRLITGQRDLTWDKNIETVLFNVREFLGKCYPMTPVFIEEPQFFDTLKGMTAAKSNSLFKLIVCYGRIFEMAYSLGLNPQALKIRDWKRQLNKKRIEARVERVAGKIPDEWKGDVLDAVAMGFYLKGILYART